MKRIIFILTMVFLLTSCTENSRARNYGGTAKLEVPCGERVTNITWKGDELWYSTLPMEEGYVPKTHSFREESSFGVIQGKYLLIESKCE